MKKNLEMECDFMAMIICPNCREQVSDKAKKCVHCRYSLIQEETKKCTECGAELVSGLKECPICGCPIAEMSFEDIMEKPQKVEVTGVKITRRAKRIISILIVVLFVGVAFFVGVNQYQKKKEAEAYEQRVDAYAENLRLVTYSMLSGASDAESCCNLIKSVWYNVIYEKRDEETDKFTLTVDGYFVSDFNKSLRRLFADEDFKKQLDDIESNRELVGSLIKELNNPPEEYENACEVIMELYDAYISLTNLAMSPTGSLQTYSVNFNEADTEFLNSYNAMEMYLDE